jgi:hypothetical protein
MAGMSADSLEGSLLLYKDVATHRRSWTLCPRRRPMSSLEMDALLIASATLVYPTG